uniref:DUF753 domain-containing protein n=1 Tax=Anopheles stephensi TaxID=30069 RepID=A0A182YIW4_ANOST
MSCYQCSSEHASNCDTEQRRDELQKCRYHRNNDGCFTRIYGDTVIRGCISDLGSDTDPCKGWKRSDCHACYDDGCNYVSRNVLRNSSSFSGTSLRTSLFFVLHYFLVLFG